MKQSVDSKSIVKKAFFLLLFTFIETFHVDNAVIMPCTLIYPNVIFGRMVCHRNNNYYREIKMKISTFKMSSIKFLLKIMNRVDCFLIETMFSLRNIQSGYENVEHSIAQIHYVY